MFGRAHKQESKLASEGHRNWRHISAILKAHEISKEHVNNLKLWLEVELRLTTRNTSDQKILDGIEKEKQHLHAVLQRILTGVEYLAKNNIAFRGKSEKIGEPKNGPFPGLMETFAKFDPTIEEHIRRIKTGEALDHYLGHNVQNELIELMAA